MHEVPEAKPAILLAWADNSADLAAIKAAGQVTELPDNPHFFIGRFLGSLLGRIMF